MKFDLHSHTRGSPDSWIKAKSLPAIAKSRGLDGIAITDHNQTKCWGEFLESAKKEEIVPILGEEIDVRPDSEQRVCEIIGLFMNERIDGFGKTPLEVVDLLHSQGALVVMPHPFDVFRNILPEDQLRELSLKIDALETLNARALKQSNEKAAHFAREFNLAETGGSDSHCSLEVGRAYTVTDAADGESLRQAILKRQTRTECVGVTNFLIQKLASRSAKFIRKYFFKD